MGQVEKSLEMKLTEAFAPTELDIVDQSHLHAGHAGAPGGGESHFRIRIVSAQFDGLGRVARQRAINNVLKAELAGPVHALSLQALTPAEA